MAAEELSVTPGAIAQHIKTLEAWVGAGLFDRKSHGVSITPLGSGVAGDLGRAFDRLGEAVQKLRAEAPQTEIRIATLPSIALLWLSPRLPGLREAVSEASISVFATETPPNLLREPVDLNLFFLEDDSDPNRLAIEGDVIFPVCAPEIASRFTHIEALREARFLHDSTWSDDWSIWLEANGHGGSFDTRGPSFSLYALAIEEAKNGGGVLMGHGALVESSLESGRLVSLFDRPLPLDRQLALTWNGRPKSASGIGRVIEILTRDQG